MRQRCSRGNAALAAHAQSRDSARHPGDRLSARQDGRNVVDQQARKLTHPPPRSTRWGQRRAARTGVAAPPASPIVVEPSVSSSATTWAPRSAAGPAMPARAVGSAAAPVVSLTLSLAAESRARTYSAKGSRVRVDTSGRSRFGLASQATSSRSVAFCGIQRCRPSRRTTWTQPIRRLGPLAPTSSS